MIWLKTHFHLCFDFGQADCKIYFNGKTVTGRIAEFCLVGDCRHPYRVWWS